MLPVGNCYDGYHIVSNDFYFVTGMINVLSLMKVDYAFLEAEILYYTKVTRRINYPILASAFIYVAEYISMFIVKMFFNSFILP